MTGRMTLNGLLERGLPDEAAAMAEVLPAELAPVES